MSASKKRGRVGASDVPSVESPESISCIFCPKIERILAVGRILTQGSCCSETANSAIQKIGDQLHIEMFYSRFRGCNWTTTFVLEEVLRPGLYIDIPE